MTLLIGAGAILTLALLSATRPSVSDGRADQASPSSHLEVSRAPAGQRAMHSRQPGQAGVADTSGTCRMAEGSSGYVNPLARAAVAPKRIDQGVDYVGSGTLTAIGTAKVTYLVTVNTGWPGAFIEYRLLAGPDVGCYVYYAEGVRPVPGLYVGETVLPGQAIATLIPRYASGIEIGWAANDGTKTYAGEKGDWSATDEADNIATAAGRHFSALIAALGGPPGKEEGRSSRTGAAAR